MVFAAPVLFAASLAAAGLPPDDLTELDAPERPKREVDPATLEAHARRRVPSKPTLTLTPGDTVFVEVDVPLSRAPKGTLDARLSEPKPGDPKGDPKTGRFVHFAPFAEVLGVDVLRGKSIAHVLAPVRASWRAREGSEKLGGTLELRDESDAVIATKPLLHLVELRPAVASKEDLELDRRAHLFFQAAALELLARRPRLPELVPLDRVEAPPPRWRVPAEDRPAFQEILHDRLLADLARERLRGAAASSDAATGDLAILALGGLAKKATGAAAKASVIDGQTNALAIDLAAAALDELDLDAAEGIVARLRQGGTLRRHELTRALLLGGTIFAARGRADATAEVTRALCLDPSAVLPLHVPSLERLLRRLLAAARASRDACATPLSLGAVTAVRVAGDDGPRIVVRSPFGPDPLELAAGGDVELWGSGGGRARAEKVRAIREPATMLEATFEDSAELTNYAGELLVKVYLRDLSGAVLASRGDPDPERLAVTSAPGADGPLLPWWAYAIGGALAVAGTITAVVLVNRNRPIERGIGPTTVEF